MPGILSLTKPILLEEPELSLHSAVIILLADVATIITFDQSDWFFQDGKKITVMPFDEWAIDECRTFHLCNLRGYFSLSLQQRLR
jgi:hypothetical protein